PRRRALVEKLFGGIRDARGGSRQKVSKRSRTAFLHGKASERDPTIATSPLEAQRNESASRSDSVPTRRAPVKGHRSVATIVGCRSASITPPLIERTSGTFVGPTSRGCSLTV